MKLNADVIAEMMELGTSNTATTSYIFDISYISLVKPYHILSTEDEFVAHMILLKRIKDKVLETNRIMTAESRL